MTDDPERVYPAPTITDVGSDKGSGNVEAPAAAASSKAVTEDGRTRKKRLQLSCGECRRKKVTQGGENSPESHSWSQPETFSN